jgi:type I restriction enzyme S subunit
MSTATLHNEKKKTLVPQLRFQEFDGEWEEKTLGDIGKIKMCKRIFSNETSEEGEIPFYKIGTFGKEADAYITNELYLNYKSKFSYPKIGDILMSASGTLGRTVVFDGKPAYFQDSNIVWIENNHKTTTNSFLYFIYQIVRYDSEGGTIQRLYNSIISNTKFYNPSLPEQKKIASFLSEVDEKIQQLTRKVTLLEQYKKGVMQQLFSGKLRFKDENGDDYPEWEEKMLGELGVFKGGGTPSTEISEYWGGETPWISSSDLNDNDVLNINVTRFITDKAISESATKVIPANSVLFVARVGVGKLAVSKRTMCTSQDFTNFIPFEINSLYLAYYFIKNNKVLSSYAQGTSIKGFTSGDLKSIKLSYPVLEEQQKIANFLSGIDTKIEKVNQQLAQTQTFKKGLLQQMFV